MDFYFILGIERAATLNDVKRAYRRLARRYHPNINPGDDQAASQFQQIVVAYETLSDPERRERYDTAGVAEVAAAQAASLGFEGFDFSATTSGAAASTFGDLFGDVLRERARQFSGETVRGADLHQSLTVTFEVAIRGGLRDLVVTRRALCRACRGAGRVEVAEHRCATCLGSGILRSVRGHMVFSKPCPSCDGAGQRADAACPACAGQQAESRTESVRVVFPAGLADGARIRVPGKGHAGRNGGDYGDLLITVHVDPHPVFRREGDDVHVTVPVAIHEAALGAKVEVPSPDGLVVLRVPPGTQSGQRFRLRERGAVSAKGERRGDLVVEAKLTLPPLLDERSKELLREFGRINGVEAIRK